jgi:hypothetical protein
MNRKVKAKPVDPARVEVPISDTLTAFPLSPESPLVRIRAMGQRIEGYIQYICSVGHLNGSSAEAKHRAVTDFCARLSVLEQELCRIQEELQLG